MLYSRFCLSLPILLLAALLPVAAQAQGGGDDEHCRVYEGNLRIDSPQQLIGNEDICEITGALAIFTQEGLETLSFPRLRKAPWINIEADDVKAISFPVLKEVDNIYVKGPRIEAVEMPSLRRVSQIFYFKTRRVQYLHLPNLVQVGQLNIQGNFELEMIFADNLYEIRELVLENNPKLDEGAKSYLNIATIFLTQEEKDQIRQAQADIRDLKRRLLDQTAAQPPMPPTGHPTSFGTIGFYYQRYPWHFWNYWNTLQRWGFQRYYYSVPWL